MTDPLFKFHFISLGMLLLFICLAGISVWNSREDFKKILQETPLKWFFIIGSIGMLLWYVIVYPGFISIDDAIALKGVKDGQVTVWTSIVYGYLLSGCDLTGLGFGGPIVLTAFFYWVIFVRTFAKIQEIKFAGMSRFLVPAIVTLLFLWPTQVGFLSYQNRDGLFAVLVANLFFVILNLKNSARVLILAELVLYFGLLSTVRYEGLIPAALGLIYLFRRKSISRKALYFVAALVMTAFLANLRWSKQQLFWDSLSKHYQVIHYVTVLSAILNSPEVKMESPSMKELSKYYKLDCLRELKEKGWYSNARGRCVNDEEFSEIGWGFYSALLGVYSENFKVVASHFNEKLVRIFNQSMMIQDVETESREAENLIPDEMPVKSRIFNYLQAHHRYTGNDTGPTWLLFSVLVAVLAMVLLPREVSLLLLIFHIRIPIVLFFSPDPQSRYLFTLCTLLPISVVLLIGMYAVKSQELPKQ